MNAKNRPSRRLGYARVSTYGQTLDAQLEQLRQERCNPIYREKASGAQVDRREFIRMVKDLAPGDVVTVTRIDRLEPKARIQVSTLPSLVHCRKIHIRPKSETRRCRGSS